MKSWARECMLTKPESAHATSRGVKVLPPATLHSPLNLSGPHTHTQDPALGIQVPTSMRPHTHCLRLQVCPRRVANQNRVCGVALHGVVWCGVVWLDVVWSNSYDLIHSPTRATASVQPPGYGTSPSTLHLSPSDWDLLEQHPCSVRSTCATEVVVEYELVVVPAVSPLDPEVVHLEEARC